MKRIVIFNDHWCSGGVESLWTNLIAHMPKNDFEFIILATQKETDIYDSFLNEKGVKLISIFNRVISNPVIRTQKNISGFKKKIAELKPDILHINSVNASGLRLAYIAKKLGINKIIVHSHISNISNDKFKLKRLAHKYWKKKYQSAADYHFGCSKESLEFMFNSNDGIILKNGVDLDKFKYNEDYKKEIRDKYNISYDSFVIGNVGRFSYQKNHKFILDIFNIYNNDKAVLFFVGEGELENKTKKYAKKLGILDRVIFAGTTDEAYKYYSAFDAFVLPSIYEGLPVVAVEAQATGLPVLISENVTKEAKLIDSTIYLPINDPRMWANEVEKARAYKRTVDNDSLKKQGFDIIDSSNKLLDFYKNII